MYFLAKGLIVMDIDHNTNEVLKAAEFLAEAVRARLGKSSIDIRTLNLVDKVMAYQESNRGT